MIVNVCASSRNYRDAVYYVPSNYFTPEERSKSPAKGHKEKTITHEKTPKMSKAPKKFQWLQKLKSKLIKKKSA